MMMKKYYFYLMALAMACLTLSLFSCGGDDDVDEPSEDITILLRSQSIQEGEQLEPATPLVLTLEYNTTVRPVEDGDITLNGMKMIAISNSTTTMKVDIPLLLEPDKNFTLKVAKGAIVSTIDSRVSAPEFTLHFTSKALPVISTAPVNASATDATKRLYTFFRDKYGQKVISSVMADVNWNNKNAEKIHTLTGKYPAMNCYDFIHIYVPDQGSNGWIDYTDITPVKQWSDAGGIVQLMWHFNVPLNESTQVKTDGSGVTCSPSETTFRAKNVLTEGTWENRWFYQEMDKVVDVILKLQDEGIAATWRPFHEAAGNATAKQQANWTTAWFWWGYDGPETFKSLWTTMYDYFKQKGVNNLIWIWTTQNYNGNSRTYNQDTDWYPGYQYVDMVARDLYGYNAVQNALEFEEIQSTYPNKMVVLGECGNSKTNQQGMISYCWTSGAFWGHFMVWYEGGNGSTNTMVSDAWWTEAMTSDFVITRDHVTY